MNILFYNYKNYYKKNYNYDETILLLNKYKLEYYERIKRNNVIFDIYMSKMIQTSPGY